MFKMSICNEKGFESICTFSGTGSIYPVTCIDEHYNGVEYEDDMHNTSIHFICCK